ncbi:MAG: hypothetical protein Q3972_02390 [Corynebacterium sp.]|nr:hypothetical protein [Corynebacterium sp.]
MKKFSRCAIAVVTASTLSITAIAPNGMVPSMAWADTASDINAKYEAIGKYFGKTDDEIAKRRAADGTTDNSSGYFAELATPNFEGWYGVASAANLGYAVPAWQPDTSNVAQSFLDRANTFLASVNSSSNPDAHPSISVTAAQNTSSDVVSNAVVKALVEYGIDNTSHLTTGQKTALKNQLAGKGFNDLIEITTVLTPVIAKNGLDWQMSLAKQAVARYQAASGTNDIANAYNAALTQLVSIVNDTADPVVVDAETIAELIATLENAQPALANYNQVAAIANLSETQRNYFLNKIVVDYKSTGNSGDETAGVAANLAQLRITASGNIAKDSAIRATQKYITADPDLKAAYQVKASLLPEMIDSETNPAALKKANDEFVEAYNNLTAALNTTTSTEQPSTNETDEETPAEPSKSGSSGSSIWWLGVPAIIAAIIGARWVSWYQINPGWFGDPPMWWWYSNFPPNP